MASLMLEVCRPVCKMCAKRLRLSCMRNISGLFTQSGYRRLSTSNDRDRKGPSSQEIRKTFLDFFKVKYDHLLVPSSSIVPKNDPTLLFINAGMNQFKPLIQGTVDPRSDMAKYRRVVNSQKCIRAGGKHNDLEDVGRDCYHHTVFEMLGNWSFGDFFKKEACAMAWELLTDVYRIPVDRLYITYFGGDTELGLQPDLECREIWASLGVPAARILPCGMRDNFWEMGDVGPCGPCTEIHYDHRGVRAASRLVNTDSPEVVELWNLVFMQFNREFRRQPAALPAMWWTQGMGLERLVAVLQGKLSNYDTDVFSPILHAIHKVGEAEVGWFLHNSLGLPTDMVESMVSNRGFRMDMEQYSRIEREALQKKTQGLQIAQVPTLDAHSLQQLQALGVPPTDNSLKYKYRLTDSGKYEFPSPEGHVLSLYKAGQLVDSVGRGDVCSVILDRTCFYPEAGGQESDQGNMTKNGGEAFPELVSSQEKVMDTINEDEALFLSNLEKGKKLMSKTVRKMDKSTLFPAEVGWFLHNSLGLPTDMVESMVSNRGFRMDMEQYSRIEREALQKKTQGLQIAQVPTLDAHSLQQLQALGVPPTDNSLKYKYRLTDSGKYEFPSPEGHVLSLYKAGQLVDSVGRGDVCSVILDRTCFYPEAGGQESDQGNMTKNGVVVFTTESVQVCGGYVLHQGQAQTALTVDDTVQLNIDQERRLGCMQRHTATHLLNHGLREVLGEECEQRGSHVGPNRLRFDFSVKSLPSPEELKRVEETVQAMVDRQQCVYSREVSLNQAKQVEGIRTMDEEYPDPVRVVSVGTPVEELVTNPSSGAACVTSVELCCGTHVHNTASIEAFVISYERRNEIGSRRIIAITGSEALEARKTGAELEERAKTLEQVVLNGETSSLTEMEEVYRDVGKLIRRVDTANLPLWKRLELQVNLDRLQSQANRVVKKLQKQNVERVAQSLVDRNGDVVLVTDTGLGPNLKVLRTLVRLCSELAPDTPIMLFGTDTRAASVRVACKVPEVMASRGLEARTWLDQVMSEIKAKGRGDEKSATAAGENPAGTQTAIIAARKYAHGVLR
ncbi:PREDICTED: alanine--tRNA ligase, mitochondrial-like [Branchiostoma belcheri]|uniref:Alanine--tRNA ligase n=1 Tax=Branchiostoma belcheri TaxID=7741 RepID=A0A6P5A7P0_BRABE|nr:PREDICTED: alanine--tRNA ligase, mitochondrial-like [Branchiostoma belcheri]